MWLFETSEGTMIVSRNQLVIPFSDIVARLLLNRSDELIKSILGKWDSLLHFPFTKQEDKRITSSLVLFFCLVR
jgi:hypothetical protein